MKLKSISRRSVLRGIGGIAISLPFLEAMGCSRGGSPALERTGTSSLALGSPKRFVVMYTPNGTFPDKWWPTKVNSETDYEFSEILKPLEPHRKKLLLLGNITEKSALYGPGDAHQKGTGQALTCTELQEGDFEGADGRKAGWANGISVDQKIAETIGLATKLRSLELGVRVAGANLGSRISYLGPAQPIPPINDPYSVFKTLFSDFGVDQGTLDIIRARRASVLDSIKGDYESMMKRLGAEDRHKLEGHLTAIREVEAGLNKGASASAACEAPVLEAGVDDKDTPKIGKMQMDLLVMALACDLTRVSSLMWTNSATDKPFPWLEYDGKPIMDAYHDLAHKDPVTTEGRNEKITIISHWYAEQYAYLLEKMAAIDEGDGMTLLDNSAVLWINEQAEGYDHDRHNMPYVLGGSAGGALKTGRYVKQSKERTHSEMLLTIMNAMGLTDKTFGNSKYCKGVLENLLA